MPSATPAALAVVVLLASSAASLSAFAGSHAVAPAGGGLPALDVSVDVARGVVEAGGLEIAIPIDHAALPPEGAVTGESVPIGQGNRGVHGRVPPKASEGQAGPA